MRALVARALPVGIVLGLAIPAYAVSDPSAQGAKHIERLAGCFAVTYRFAEDGEHDLFSEDYGLHEPVKEWIGLERNGSSELAVVHHSVGEDGALLPHFHEVWTYRAKDSAWTQAVWSGSPDDPRRELRYRCTAEWERNRWQCHAGKATKPFRDDGAPFGFDRTDYDWLDRKNTLLVTDEGWVHSESNEKRTEDGDLVSYELGWITYRRLDDGRCGDAARDEPDISR